MYSLTDFKGLNPCLGMHKILISPDSKPFVDQQRRLNPRMKEVVRNEVIRLLDAGIIYPISDSKWVSPVHFIAKKGGITIKPNENNELIPHRTIVGYQMCINYRNVNRATKK